MNDKNILVAADCQSKGEGIVKFLTDYLTGRNLRLSFCSFAAEHDNRMCGNPAVAKQISAICAKREVAFTEGQFIIDFNENFERQTAYVDLLIIEKNALLPLALKDVFGTHSCSIIVVPAHFKLITNVLIVHDGTTASIKSIKGFFQLFSNQLANISITLLVITPLGAKDMESSDEMMLLGYLKQYTNNVGILKVREPLNDKLLRAVSYNDNTMVVGTLSYFLSMYGEESIFKPIFDEMCALFLPADT
jgi:hypothetical protein